MKATTVLTLLTGAATALLISCGSNPVAGGGSDMPNGAAIAGVVYDMHGDPVPRQEVVLRRIHISTAGDSVLEELIDTADNAGAFAFGELDSGEYVMVCQDEALSQAAIVQQIEVNKTDTVEQTIRLNPCIGLVGHVHVPGKGLSPDVNVFIPGYDLSAMTETMGRYVLQCAPQGEYDIGFIYDGVLNFTRISVRAGIGELVHMRDIEIAVLDIMAADTKTLYDHGFDRSYYVTPRFYDKINIPRWYEGIDFERILYYRPAGNAFVPWENEPNTSLGYDTVLTGIVFGDSAGALQLVQFMGDTVCLLYDKEKRFLPEPAHALVAARKVDSTAVCPYAVVEILLDPLFCESFLEDGFEYCPEAQALIKRRGKLARPPGRRQAVQYGVRTGAQ